MKRIIIFFLLILFSINCIYSDTFKKNKVSVPLRFDYYYSYDMVIEALKKLHQTYPRITRLDLVGKSEEGRYIYAMTVNNPKTGKELDKPGIYVDGNIHGNEIQATEVALYLLNYLLTKYGDNQEITKLVDKNCFYVVPMVNVDGRYHFLEGKRPSNNRSLRVPVDDDHDGLVDEDFPDDLDGDGNICLMRKLNPNGTHKADPIDPRILVKVKPGEKGEWIILGEEGIDNDGDGKVNEDAEGYLDPNRNWGFDWMPNYVQSGAGNYPFSGVGIKALAQYIRKRPNICLAWAFHNFGGMFLRGPSTKAQGEYNLKDVAVYDYLGEQAERITPGYRYLIGWKDLYTTYGDFVEWMVMINGAYAFVGELFMTQSETFRSIKETRSKTTPTDTGGFFNRPIELERERMKFNDNLTHGELFKSWKPFKHPTYGDIEIGGWVKLSTRISAPFMLEDLVHRNASAVIFSAKNTPEISMKIFDKRKIGNNLYRIRVRLVNSKAIPTMSYHAQKVNLYPKDILKVQGKNVKVLLGGVLEDKYRDKVTYKEFRPEIQFFVIPGFGKIEFQFMVSGSGKIYVKYNSRHTGKIVKSILLN